MTKEQMVRKAQDLMIEAFDLYAEAEAISYSTNVWYSAKKDSKIQFAGLKAFYAAQWFEKAAKSQL